MTAFLLTPSDKMRAPNQASLYNMISEANTFSFDTDLKIDTDMQLGLNTHFDASAPYIIAQGSPGEAIGEAVKGLAGGAIGGSFWAIQKGIEEIGDAFSSNGNPFSPGELENIGAQSVVKDFVSANHDFFFPDETEMNFSVQITSDRIPFNGVDKSAEIFSRDGNSVATVDLVNQGGKLVVKPESVYLTETDGGERIDDTSGVANAGESKANADPLTELLNHQKGKIKEALDERGLDVENYSEKQLRDIHRDVKVDVVNPETGEVESVDLAEALESLKNLKGAEKMKKEDEVLELLGGYIARQYDIDNLSGSDKAQVARDYNQLCQNCSIYR